jgi:hypothetical protein
MLVEFGVIESEASRLVKADGVHVALSERSGTSGIVAVTESGERAEFAPCGDLGAVQCDVGVFVGLTGEIQRVDRAVTEERNHRLCAQTPSSQPVLAHRDPQSRARALVLQG